MYFSKLCLRTQFLVAIKFVRAFLGIVEKWFWRLLCGRYVDFERGENVDMLRLRSKSQKFWPKTLGTDTSTVTISLDF